MANVPVAVTLPAPDLEVEAVPVPSPRVRLPKAQAAVPPKLPVPSRRKMPSEIFIVPLPVTSPPRTVILTVPDKVPAVTVRSPPKVVLVVNDQPPPERLKVTLLNCEPPGSTVLPVKMELKVTVPPCAVKVAEFSQLPPTVRLKLETVVSSVPAEIVRSLVVVALPPST